MKAKRQQPMSVESCRSSSLLSTKALKFPMRKPTRVLLSWDQKHSIPLIGDGCAVPLAGVVPMQENLYCCHGAVLRPTIIPQDLRAFAHGRQALGVIVPNDSWIVVGVPDPQPHHPPGITVHTSVYMARP